MQAGDMVRIPPLKMDESAPTGRPSDAWERRIRGAIVLDNADLLVINKPTGLAVHGGSGVRLGLIESLRSLFPDARYLELVHRLDRDTSGLVLVQKCQNSQGLHEQLRNDAVDKRYWHWWRVNGLRIRKACRRRWPNGIPLRGAHCKGRPGRQGRQNRDAGRGTVSGRHLIEAKPVSGRTHQIRVHTQHIGHPILGDSKYQNDQSQAVSATAGLKRLFLHARAIAFELAGER